MHEDHDLLSRKFPNCTKRGMGMPSEIPKLIAPVALEKKILSSMYFHFFAIISEEEGCIGPSFQQT